ncbi:MULTISPECIES: polysaccharide biosynthesis protein [unclassified Fusibacter]|uniref:putative polysaccharide biosynthesis protein n=1 Tax=unclassified Fusibacter TaxID=2624464 RepID=UPI0013E914EF|nr:MULTISPECIES: polysaccharide biosynthesis protein [unclassified Fusibacter]MCK8059523.1 polysaccharide biosynthesis protein [Fusibacter sp. A2]NPE21013.1 polysaccharide biosynthesis protein [Fusibacter sp. A1]
MSQKNKSFVNAALIFGVAGIIVKILGAFYKVPLGNILGEEGSSYVASVYPYYNWLLVVSSAGFPAAIAKLVSEHEARGEIIEAEKLFGLMRRVMTLIGLSTMTILFFLAPVLTSVSGNERAVYSMQAIAIALFFVSYMSSYRGYFQGHHNLTPFGLSQIIEQIGRVATGLVLAIVLIPYGAEFAAAGATFAATFGAILGTILLFFYYRNFRKKNNIPKVKAGRLRDNKAVIKRVIFLAIPITIGASVMPLVNMIDTFIIINRLQDIGYGETAKSFYSYHAFYAASLVNFPQILFTAIQVSLLPAVSALKAVNDRIGLENTVKTGMKVALLLGVPSAIGLFVLSGPILSLLWPNLDGVVQFAPNVLKVVSLSLIALSLFQATTGILQGIGKQHAPARNLMIGAAFKIVACYVLVGIPSINILGAGLSTILAFSVAVVLNVMAVFKEIKPKFSITHTIAKPVIASIVMGVAVHFGYILLIVKFGNVTSTALSVVAGVVVYGVMLFVIKALDADDLAFLPGKRILKKLVR